MDRSVTDDEGQIDLSLINFDQYKSGKYDNISTAKVTGYNMLNKLCKDISNVFTGIGTMYMGAYNFSLRDWYRFSTLNFEPIIQVPFQYTDEYKDIAEYTKNITNYLTKKIVFKPKLVDSFKISHTKLLSESVISSVFIYINNAALDIHCGFNIQIVNDDVLKNHAPTYVISSINESSNVPVVIQNQLDIPNMIANMISSGLKAIDKDEVYGYDYISTTIRLSYSPVDCEDIFDDYNTTFGKELIGNPNKVVLDMEGLNHGEED